MKEKFAFYLQHNNHIFSSDILSICYKADENEIKEYGLTSENILILINNIEIEQLKGKKI